MSEQPTKLEMRKKYATQLDDAWIMLDRARSFGDERTKLLDDLLDFAKELLHPERGARLLGEEVLALAEFIYYERDHTVEIYRLHQGVMLLKTAIEEYYINDKSYDLRNLEYIYLSELLNLFIAGEYIQTERLGILDELIKKGKDLISRIPENDWLLRSKCLVSLGDAFKEKAMITEEPSNYKKAFMSSREYCQKAIDIVKEYDNQDAKHILGMAYRHIAVTFELQADITLSKEERVSFYKDWQRFSYDALNILSSINEYTTRAYSLINLASSNTRLYEHSNNNDPSNKQLLYLGKDYIENAIKLFYQMGDYRGIGWSYYHLCENTRHRCRLMKNWGNDEYETLLYELESYANQAIAAAKHTEDYLLFGLAFTELGNVLFTVFKHHSGVTMVKLMRAITALEEGIRYLIKTGYHRGTGSAYRTLGECYFELWIQKNDEKYFIKAIEVLTEGIQTTGKNIGGSLLDKTYNQLCEILEKLL